MLERPYLTGKELKVFDFTFYKWKLWLVFKYRSRHGEFEKNINLQQIALLKENIAATRTNIKENLLSGSIEQEKIRKLQKWWFLWKE